MALTAAVAVQPCALSAQRSPSTDAIVVGGLSASGQPAAARQPRSAISAGSLAAAVAAEVPGAVRMEGPRQGSRGPATAREPPAEDSGDAGGSKFWRPCQILQSMGDCGEHILHGGSGREASNSRDKLATAAVAAWGGAIAVL
ncbi:unnamed protein product [Prorocentrum cordatum]|uniref:Uncharacterized protein n=1 Tax=Prorocentrum cordatum TaxID=2364126 RepID=A0ABN9WXP1_9DINO|nr:unnamed protein product [Polarella glacialis]